ncbi:MAG TPA: pyridoxal-phosphate dependent enzyme, partial [Gammaproteobacteria bacterium]|nr:pyridoxal-phosphate dependent enzyme [Gammaproteobacteria bacterium]
LVAAQKGYRLVLVIPDKMSQEKIFNLRAMGAEVVLTRSDVAKGHPEYYQDMAKRIAEEQGGFFVNQFGNPDNVKAHEETTGPEIWEQMEGRLDAVVAGVGSSGTLTGIGHYLRRVAPHVEMVLADPKGSVLVDYIRTGVLGEKGGWLVEGIGEDFVPDICDLSVVKHAYTIPDSEAFAVSREVLRKEGILLGSSSGVLIGAALRYCRAQKTPKRVVTIGADTGNKYLSKLYNDFWMIEQGFMERPKRGDLGDYVGRPYWERATVYVGPGDTLATAHTRMRNNGISQLPVIDGKAFLGAVSEMDLIQAVQRDPRRFTQEVRSALNPNFPRIDARQQPESLASLMEIETAVAIMDGDTFLGLVTRSDILNRLRLQ